MNAEHDAQALCNALGALTASAKFFAALAHRFPHEPERSFFERLGRIAQLQASHLLSHEPRLVRLGVDFGFRSEQLFTTIEWLHADEIGTDELFHIARCSEDQARRVYLDQAFRAHGSARGLLRMLAAGALTRKQMIEDAFSRRVAARAFLVPYEDVLLKMLHAEHTVARYYRALARDARPAVRRFFDGMSDVEDLHAGQVASLLRESLLGDSVLPSEVVSLRFAASHSWLPSEDLLLNDAMQITRDVSGRSASYYRWLAEYLCGDERENVLNFAETEAQHVAMISHYLGDQGYAMAG